MSEAFASELRDAAASMAIESIATLGGRIHDAYADDEQGLRALVRRTCDLMKEPATIVRLVVAVGKRPPVHHRQRTPALLAIVDDAVDTWLREHEEPLDESGEGLFEALLWEIGRKRTSALANMLSFPKDEHRRSERVEGLSRWLLRDLLAPALASRKHRAAAWIDGPLTRRADPNGARVGRLDALFEALCDETMRSTLVGTDQLVLPVTVGLVAAACALSPHSNAGVRNAVRAVRCLPSDDVASVMLSLLSSVLPRAVAAPGALVVPKGDGTATALWIDNGEICVLDGDEDMEGSLPKRYRPLLRETVKRGFVRRASFATVVLRSDETTTWRRQGIFGALEVAVELHESFGFSIPSVVVKHAGNGVVVSLFGTFPEMVAVHEREPWVWQQTARHDGRLHAVHALAPDAPPSHRERPPRGEVFLVSELIGPGCPSVASPNSKQFLFEGEDEASPPAQPRPYEVGRRKTPRRTLAKLGVVIGPGMPLEISSLLCGRPLEEPKGEHEWTSFDEDGKPVPLVRASITKPGGLAPMLREALDRCDRVVVGVPVRPVSAKPDSVLVASSYVDLDGGAATISLESLWIAAADRVAEDHRIALAHGTYGGDVGRGLGGAEVAVLGKPLGLGVDDAEAAGKRILLLTYVLMPDGTVFRHGLGEGGSFIRVLRDSISYLAGMR